MKWGSWAAAWGAPGLVLGAWTRSDFYLRSHAIMRPGPRDDARDNNMVHVHMVMPLHFFSASASEIGRLRLLAAATALCTRVTPVASCMYSESLSLDGQIHAAGS